MGGGRSNVMVELAGREWITWKNWSTKCDSENYIVCFSISMCTWMHFIGLDDGCSIRHNEKEMTREFAPDFAPKHAKT